MPVNLTWPERPALFVKIDGFQIGSEHQAAIFKDARTKSGVEGYLDNAMVTFEILDGYVMRALCCPNQSTRSVYGTELF